MLLKTFTNILKKLMNCMLEIHESSLTLNFIIINTAHVSKLTRISATFPRNIKQLAKIASRGKRRTDNKMQNKSSECTAHPAVA